MTEPIIDPAATSAFETDGAVFLPGLLNGWMDEIEAGIEANLANPGEFAAESVLEGEDGRFFDDYCNWRRIPEFRQIIEGSPLAQAAAELMGSDTAQFFHEHVLVKFPGTSKPTPWHSDGPYYFVEGSQTVSFWAPADPVSEASLRMVAGSHRWEKPILPVRWAKGGDFYDSGDYMDAPDPDAAGSLLRVLEWDMRPGDVVAFNFDTLHGARANLTGTNRRAFSTRWVGDDARYVERPGRTSPPFPGHGMKSGERLRDDWFPVLYPRSA